MISRKYLYICKWDLSIFQTLKRSIMKHFFLFLILIPISVIVMSQNSSDTYTYKVGEIEVSLLNEVQNQGNKSILIGASAEVLEKTIPNGTFPNAVNAFLIKDGNKNILVDTGFGTKLFDNLLSLGVTPEQINIVLLTHMHGDHISGMLKDGKKAFPNAKVYVSQAEHQYWTENAKSNKSQQEVFSIYKDELTLFEPVTWEEKENLLPNIKAIKAYGHTPGQTMFLIESGNQELLIWADLTHAMAVQMPYPQISVTYDNNPEAAAAVRIAVLKYVAKNNITIAGMHIPYPAIGMITEGKDNGYIFTPVE